MADESMVRNLAAQALAIWPQEAPLYARYALPRSPRILDAGCGTGEIASRLAGLFPKALVLGIDIIDEHLALARSRYERLAPAPPSSARAYRSSLPATGRSISRCAGTCCNRFRIPAAC